MAWTYDLTTDIGKVRLNISDINTNEQLFQDAEIQYFLDSNNGSILLAAVDCCLSMAARLAGDSARVAVDGILIDNKMSSDDYLKLASALRTKAALNSNSTFGVVYIGGVSEADKIANNDDQDRIKPEIEGRQFDNRFIGNIRGLRSDE